MKIFFTYSWGDLENSVSLNFNSAKCVFPEVELIQGKETILDTYFYLSSLSPDNMFVWIDGDNQVKPEAIKILDCKKPSILSTINEYGIVYGHGGIKLCPTSVVIRKGVIDVTYYLGLNPVDVIGSYHGLGDGWIKYRAIFVEMIKCALKGEHYNLIPWQRVRPDIWKSAEYLLTTSDIDTVIDLIRNRNSFKRYYENSLRINMQE